MLLAIALWSVSINELLHHSSLYPSRALISSRAIRCVTIIFMHREEVDELL
jgi:hypothetical protein